MKLSTLLALAAAAACGAQPDGNESTARTHQELGPVQVTGLSTGSGWVGDTVTIYGNGFTTDGYTQVQFSPADPSQAFPFTNTICSTTARCTFNVPEMKTAIGSINGVPDLFNQVRFQVVVHGTPLPDNSGSGGIFTLTPIALTSISPTSIPSTGGSITIRGAGFFDGRYAGNAVAPGNYFTSPMEVTFNAPGGGGSFPPSWISCNYWPGTACTVEVPAMPSTVGLGEPLTLRINGYAEGAATAAVPITYTAPPPPPPCQPHGCQDACGGQTSDGCGGTITCNGCPTGYDCVGGYCEDASTCLKVPHCPKGTVFTGPPDCACEGLN